MDILEAIRGRRAVRAYQPRPVGAEVVRSLIETAVWAPSGVNLQPWSFVVEDDAQRLATYSAQAKALMLGSDAALPETLRPILSDQEFKSSTMRPALIVICATMEGEMALKDCCLAAQTLMLAAHAQGLGTCWIGFAEAWLASEAGRAQLGLRPQETPVAPIILGYPAAAPPATERRAPDIRYVAAKR